MVNSLLLLTNDRNELAFVDPISGNITSTAKLPAPADLAPIAAAGNLLVLTRDATLTAYS
jgi:hypothetical protein